MPSVPRGDLFARLLGVFVFLLGLAVILCVLWLGFRMYSDPNLGLRSSKPHSPPDAVDIGTAFLRLVVRIALLFLGSICGSLIANKGIRLYFAGAGTRQPHE
ncbi:MAG: hypothetical protein ACP5VE_13665 [Chthonomonadales bacterium]